MQIVLICWRFFLGPILSGPGDLSDLKPETTRTISGLVTGWLKKLSFKKDWYKIKTSTKYFRSKTKKLKEEVKGFCEGCATWNQMTVAKQRERCFMALLEQHKWMTLSAGVAWLCLLNVKIKWSSRLNQGVTAAENEMSNFRLTQDLLEQDNSFIAICTDVIGHIVQGIYDTVCEKRWPAYTLKFV